MLIALLAATLGLLLTLACRKTVRKLFGAGPAFTLWLLPALLAALPSLPNVPLAWITMRTTLVLPAARSLMAQALPAFAITRWLIALWLIGMLSCLVRLCVRHAGIMRKMQALPDAMLRGLPAEIGATNRRRLRLHADGPAVLWAPRSLLLLPPDFLERFDSTGRQLVLRHELAHLSRGDTWWNLLAELAAAALWFHPLVWLAMPRFRLDQELACDETVLRRSPADGLAYATTLLNSVGVGINAAPMLIPWLAEPQLKERLTMIQRFHPGVLRRRIGFIGVAALMLGLTVVSRAAVDTHTNNNAAPDNAYNAGRAPQYPASAINNHEQGTVVLKVMVGKDGRPQTINVESATDASPALIKASSDAVSQWHFTPQMRDGKPIAAYASVPIRFAMTVESAAPPPPPPAPPTLPPAPPPPPPPPPVQSSPTL